MKHRTWKVLKWDNPGTIIDWIPLPCKCGYEADCPTNVDLPIIAMIGMGLVFDPPNYEPPPNFMPNEIQCRRCKRIYTDE